MANINNISVNGETYGIGNSIYAEMDMTEDRFTELLSRDFYTPTRTTEPTEDTLTYIDTDLSTCNYRIGQQCRVYDTTKEKYVFYQLYNITSENKAEWAKVGGGTYETLNVTLAVDEAGTASDLIGTTFHVKYTEDGEEVDNVSTWNGETVSLEVPAGYEYTISYDDATDDSYTTPATLNTVSLANSTRDVTATYMKLVSTITIDQSISDPATMITGDINGAAIQWIRNNSHRVLAKKTADGEVTYCRLDDSNSNFYYDGTTAARLNSSEGDVFMKMPTFYYKSTGGEETDIATITFSKTKLDDSYIEWDTNTLIGVFKGYGYYTNATNNRIYSIAGEEFLKESATYQETTFARMGTGYQPVDWQMHCVMFALAIAQYGTTNLEYTLGEGYYSSSSSSKYTPYTTDATVTGGMTDTVYDAATASSHPHMSFWGLTDWWTDSSCSEPMHGINGVVYGGTNSYGTYEGTYLITDPDGSTRTFTSWGHSGGYIKRYIIGDHLDFIPSAKMAISGASSTTYWCNYWSVSYDSTFAYTNRSTRNDNSAFGVRTSNTNSSSIYSRLCFRGTCIEETDIEAYKAITALV